MKTKIININRFNFYKQFRFPKNRLRSAAKALRDGKLVIFPTETVYGIGANALNDMALSNIFKAKGRPMDNPLIVHISDLNMLQSLVDPDYLRSSKEVLTKIIKAFWPGALTIIMPRNSDFKSIATAGLNTVAVRFPSSLIARTLIELARVPVAAPSANISGKPSSTKYSHVLKDFSGKVDYIVSGGRANIGLESTVLDLSDITMPEILRPGYITKADIFEKTGIEVKDYKEQSPAALTTTPKSPGMKYRHYAPEADLYLYEGDEELSGLFDAQIIHLLSNREDELAQNLGASTIHVKSSMDIIDKQIREINNPKINSSKINNAKVYILTFKEWEAEIRELLENKQFKNIFNSRLMVFENDNGITLQLDVNYSISDMDLYAREIYAILRNLDDAGIDIAFMPILKGDGIKKAIYNRLNKAALKK